MKINFIEASQIVDFIDHAHELLAVPHYVTYDYLRDKLQLEEGVGRQLNLLQYSGSYVNPLFDRMNLLNNDKVAQSKAFENYERFDTYYQKAKELQSFEIKQG